MKSRENKCEKGRTLCIRMASKIKILVWIEFSQRKPCDSSCMIPDLIRGADSGVNSGYGWKDGSYLKNMMLMILLMDWATSTALCDSLEYAFFSETKN